MFRQEVIRPLLRRPWFALAVLACFAFGIGLNAIVMSAAGTLLFKPLPFAEPERLVHIQATRGAERGPLSWREARELRERVAGFADLAAYQSDAAYNLSGEGLPEEIPAAIATHNLFAVLGVPLQHGRGWPAQFDRERNFGIVLSHELFQRRFGGDPKRLGTQITLDGYAGYEIFGVAPPGFDFPSRRGLFRSSGIMPDWIEKLDARSGYAVARLASGIDLRTVQAQVDQAAADLAQLSPGTNEGIGFEVRPLAALYSGGIRTHLHLLMLAGALLLLVACANIANLFLARALEEEREIGIARALGAGNARLLRPVLLRATILACSGALLGLIVAWLLSPTLWQGFASTLPAWMSISLRPGVAAAMAALAVASALATAAWPARHLLRLNLREVVSRESRSSAGRATSRFQRGVLIVQLAFTALLVGGATGIGSAFLRLEAADPGFAVSGRETFRIALPWSKYSADDGSTLRFHRALESKLLALPGVAQVAWSTYLPLAMRRGTAAGTVETSTELTLEGQDLADQQRNPQVLEESVSPNYVDAMGMTLLQGRSFAATDHRDAPRVGLLNRRAAERLWPGESPLGKRLKVGRPDSSAAWLTVVGVVEDVRHDAAAVATTPTLYTSTDQLPHPNLFVVVRHRGVPIGPEAAAAAVRAIDPDQSIYEYASLPSLHAAQLWQQRLTSRLFTVFAVCALGLALVGTYGLVSLWMQQRQREIGIRCALGATERDLRRMSRREALRIALVAALVALPGAAVVAVWSSRLVALAASDVALLAAGAVTALGIAVVMMLLPAWRRSRADALAPLLRA